VGELLRPELVELRELALDPPGRQPGVVDPEQDLVLLYAELQGPSWGRQPPDLLERPGGNDRLELGDLLRHRRLLVREPVGVGRRHDQLAVAELDQDSGEDGARLVTRYGPAHRCNRRKEGICVDRVRGRGIRVRQLGKVLGTVRVEAILGRPTPHLEHALVLAVLDLDIAAGQKTGKVREQAPGNDHCPGSLDFGLERCPQRELHVGGGKLDRIAADAKEDPAEDLNGRARGDTATYDSELLRELLARACQLETGAERCLYVTHICKKTFRSS
jgi:hypothetical protein